jgi:hypothetical protein
MALFLHILIRVLAVFGTAAHRASRGQLDA